MSRTFDADEHERSLRALEAQWRSLSAAKLAAWEADLQAMCVEQQAMLAAGRWVGGPADLLSIVGQSRRETYHSAMLAWLMRPSGRHRLGAAFLDAFVSTNATDANLDPDALLGCNPMTEVGAAQSIADIVVDGPGLHLVIEVKVDAVEGHRQCQRLHDDHCNDPAARFVFLTPSGRSPDSCDIDVADLWVNASFRWVKETLDTIIAARAHSIAQDRVAEASLRSYQATLERVFP